MKNIVIGLSVAVVVACVAPALGTVILPEDDVTYRGSSRYNNTSVYGLFTKGNGTSDRAYVEFVAGGETATSASLKLYNYWSNASAPINFDVRIRAISEDEAGYVSWTTPRGQRLRGPHTRPHGRWWVISM